MHSESILLYIPNECHHAINDFFNKRKYINKTMFVEKYLHTIRGDLKPSNMIQNVTYK